MALCTDIKYAGLAGVLLSMSVDPSAWVAVLLQPDRLNRICKDDMRILVGGSTWTHTAEAQQYVEPHVSVDFLLKTILTSAYPQKLAKQISPLNKQLQTCRCPSDPSQEAQ